MDNRNIKIDGPKSCLPSQLYIFINQCRVMRQSWTTCELVSLLWDIVTVRTILTDKDVTPLYQPFFILVEFNNYRKQGFEFCVFAIKLILRSWGEFFQIFTRE